MSHHPAIIVGGGQAGLSTSYYLSQAHIDHIILERDQVASSWATQRWDSFCLVTPNWQCRLPGYPYPGSDPDGFMVKDQIVEYVKNYAEFIEAPVRRGVAVHSIRRPEPGGAFVLETSRGHFTEDQVVMAIGGFHRPRIPRMAEHLPRSVRQLHSSQYRNPGALPRGGVLVVGTGQSGCQIAEDLKLAGRDVHLCLGDAPRSPRKYRGQDVVWWLEQMGFYDTPIEDHPDPDLTRKKTNHYLSGRDGGREIDLRQHALDGMHLYGFLENITESGVQFADDVEQKLDAADASYNRIRKLIDDYIAREGIEAPEDPPYTPPWSPSQSRTELDIEAAGIASVIWCIGFVHDFSFIELPVFEEQGYPMHERGVTSEPGRYFIGLPWLHTWGSGRFSHVARDAEFLGQRLAEFHAARSHADARGAQPPAPPAPPAP